MNVTKRAKRSINPYGQLSWKFGPKGKDPFEAEDALKTIQPLPYNSQQEKQRAEDVFVIKQVGFEKKRDIHARARALLGYQAKKQLKTHRKQTETQINDQFAKDFQMWLLGKDPTDPYHPAYVKNKLKELGVKPDHGPIPDPVIADYMGGFIDRKSAFLKKIALLKAGPNKYFKWTLGHYLLYYKYILRGLPYPEDQMLAEFDQYFPDLNGPRAPAPVKLTGWKDYRISERDDAKPPQDNSRVQGPYVYPPEVPLTTGQIFHGEPSYGWRSNPWELTWGKEPYICNESLDLIGEIEADAYGLPPYPYSMDAHLGGPDKKYWQPTPFSPNFIPPKPEPGLSSAAPPASAATTPMDVDPRAAAATAGQTASVQAYTANVQQQQQFTQQAVNNVQQMLGNQSTPPPPPPAVSVAPPPPPLPPRQPVFLATSSYSQVNAGAEPRPPPPAATKTNTKTKGPELGIQKTQTFKSKASPAGAAKRIIARADRAMKIAAEIEQNITQQPPPDAPPEVIAQHNQQLTALRQEQKTLLAIQTIEADLKLVRQEFGQRLQAAKSSPATDNAMVDAYGFITNYYAKVTTAFQKMVMVENGWTMEELQTAFAPIHDMQTEIDAENKRFYSAIVSINNDIIKQATDEGNKAAEQARAQFNAISNVQNSAQTVDAAVEDARKAAFARVFNTQGLPKLEVEKAKYNRRLGKSITNAFSAAAKVHESTRQAVVALLDNIAAGYNEAESHTEELVNVRVNAAQLNEENFDAAHQLKLVEHTAMTMQTDIAALSNMITTIPPSASEAEVQKTLHVIASVLAGREEPIHKNFYEQIQDLNTKLLFPVKSNKRTYSEMDTPLAELQRLFQAYQASVHQAIHEKLNFATMSAAILDKKKTEVEKYTNEVETQRLKRSVSAPRLERPPQQLLPPQAKDDNALPSVPAPVVVPPPTKDSLMTYKAQDAGDRPAVTNNKTSIDPQDATFKRMDIKNAQSKERRSKTLNDKRGITEDDTTTTTTTEAAAPEAAPEQVPVSEPPPPVQPTAPSPKIDASYAPAPYNPEADNWLWDRIADKWSNADLEDEIRDQTELRNAFNMINRYVDAHPEHANLSYGSAGLEELTKKIETAYPRFSAFKHFSSEAGPAQLKEAKQSVNNFIKALRLYNWILEERKQGRHLPKT